MVGESISVVARPSQVVASRVSFDRTAENDWFAAPILRCKLSVVSYSLLQVCDS
jgi:hypothetical protein